MTSCRGILIAGVRNVARTQMAEAILRSLTDSRLFILSGGVRYDGQIHPLATKVLHEWDISLDLQSVSSLEAAQRQSATYDVYISIDAPYSNSTTNKISRQEFLSHDCKPWRQSDHYQQQSPNQHASHVSECFHNKMENTEGLSEILAPAMPSHWYIAQDTTDVRQKWQLWSPRDPTIFHETSTRKFQDDLYEGEPLFMEFRDSNLRTSCKVNERWEVEEVDTRYAMERAFEQRLRFCRARNKIAQHALHLLHRLEKYYCEEMIINKELAAKIQALHKRKEHQCKEANTTEETGDVE